MRGKKVPAPWLKRADSIVFRGCRIFSYLGGAAVIAAMLIAVIDVILARFSHSALPSATEWITYLNIVMVFPPLAYVELERGHTQVDLFEERMPPGVTKAIRVLALILAVAVMAFLTWRGGALTAQKFLTGESSSPDAFARMAFQIWIFGAVFTVGCGMGAFSFLWTIVREFTGMSIFERKPDNGRDAGGGEEKEHVHF
jgi:TRAP-type C4-dicarboxylate transport system permease small subunit